jgi:hypothetical protein
MFVCYVSPSPPRRKLSRAYIDWPNEGAGVRAVSSDCGLLRGLSVRNMPRTEMRRHG